MSPPGQARTDFAVLHAVAAALGGDLGCRTPAEALDECARLTPLFAGVSHERIEREGHLHWPCRSPDEPGHARPYEHSFDTLNGRAQLATRPWLPPGEQPDREFPYTLVTGRRLTHYNAGTMTRRTPNLTLQPSESLDLHPHDAARLGLSDGEPVEVTSRRGTVVAPVRLTDDVSPGEVFLAFHFPDAATNLLTSDAVDEPLPAPNTRSRPFSSADSEVGCPGGRAGAGAG